MRFFKRKLKPRNGAAVAELAICAPVLILVSMALIELTSMIFVKQSLAVAAYEGAHRGVQPVATAADVVDIAEQILNQRRVQGAQVTVDPSDIPSIAAGDLFTVTVTAPSDSNGIALFRFFQPTTLRSEAVVMKEIEAQ